MNPQKFFMRGACTIFLASGLLLAAGMAQGDGHGQGRSNRGNEARGHGKVEHNRTEFRGHPSNNFDWRRHHDRVYPTPGVVYHDLGPGHHAVFHRGVRYYFGGGIWYRNDNARYIVIAPPIGVIVPFLPPFATTVWVRGAPYYYANDTYYAPSAQGYVVVPSPTTVTELGPQSAEPMAQTSADGGSVTELGPDVGETAVIAQAPAPNLFIYPRLGQGPDLQARDRADCNDWALGQPSVTDTTGPDYLRALSACLDGRGYTVK